MNRYWVTVGNTKVSIEVKPYNGVCQHCGKTNIKYLAHVKQDVADTLSRALEGQLERDEDEVAALGGAMFSGKLHKEIQVGCVCVAKYLFDCGVDVGLAKLLQKKVNTITTLLQNIAKLEKLNSPEGHKKTRKELEKVAELYFNRKTCLEDYRNIKSPSSTVLSKEEQLVLRAQQLSKYEAYRAASNAFKKEENSFRARHFNVYLYTHHLSNVESFTDDILSDHYSVVTRRYQSKLEVYVNRGAYVA